MFSVTFVRWSFRQSWRFRVANRLNDDVRPKLCFRQHKYSPKEVSPAKWLKIAIRFLRRIRGVKAGSPHQDQSSEGVSTLITWPLLVGFSGNPYKKPHLSMPGNNPSYGEICCASPISLADGLLSGTSLRKVAHFSCARK